MDLEELTKGQIILLALLISFVTSLATGIVTVTLMDQAPSDVTRSIDRVVERTVETIVPGETKIVETVREVGVDDNALTIQVVENAAPAMVSIDGHTGFFINPGGEIVSAADPVWVEGDVLQVIWPHRKANEVGDDTASTTEELVLEASVVSVHRDAGLAKLRLVVENDEKKEVSITTFLSKIGIRGKFPHLSLTPRTIPLAQKVVLLGIVGEDLSVSIGVISSLSNVEPRISLSVDAKDHLHGSPILDLKGRVLGIATIGAGSRLGGYSLKPIERFLGDSEEAAVGDAPESQTASAEAAI